MSLLQTFSFLHTITHVIIADHYSLPILKTITYMTITHILTNITYYYSLPFCRLLFVSLLQTISFIQTITYCQYADYYSCTCIITNISYHYSCPFCRLLLMFLPIFAYYYSSLSIMQTITCGHFADYYSYPYQYYNLIDDYLETITHVLRPYSRLCPCCSLLIPLLRYFIHIRVTIYYLYNSCSCSRLLIMPSLMSITHVLVKLLLMSLLQAIANVIVSNYYLCICKHIDIAAFLEGVMVGFQPPTWS